MQSNIGTISKQVQKALLNHKLYKDNEFFDLDQKKILIYILKEKLGISYQRLGKELKLTWFPIYKSAQIAKSKYPKLIEQIIKTIKI